MVSANKKIVRNKMIQKIEDKCNALRQCNTFVQAGQKACDCFCDSLLYRNAEILLLFYPFGNEIPILPILNRAWQDGKQVALPRIRSEELEIDFYLLNAHDSLAEQLEEHPYGMLEPSAGLDFFDPVIDEDKENDQHEQKIVALIPGLAFSKEGIRLGRGRGFYDRFLERLDAIEIPLVGTCFSFQVEQEVPFEVHDRNVSYLLTENGLIEL